MVNPQRADSVDTLQGDWAPAGSRVIELVLHTSGQRTHELALKLALEHVKPDRAHVIRHPSPWGPMAGPWGPIRRIDHRCSHVVSVAANCLIMEDLRPFLDANELPLVDCCGRDQFRGRATCGVQIMRTDMVRALDAVPKPLDELSYVLDPQDYLLREVADLGQLEFEQVRKTFRILSNYFQHPSDVFTTCALWGLRARAESGNNQVEIATSQWADDIGFGVARRALDQVADAVPSNACPTQVHHYLRRLPHLASTEVHNLGSAADRGRAVGVDDIERAMAADPVTLGRPARTGKVFGLGLSRTGTHSLTRALHVLGFDTVHYPLDEATLDTLVRGDACFPHLEHYDGITDITVAPYYEELDQAWPGSKFVLTVREEESWLHSCRNHWARFSRCSEANEEITTSLRIHQFLRAAVYASHDFDESRFRRVYRHHTEKVTSYFRGRDNDFLVLDIAAGEGYERLAPFLGVPVPDQPFPHRSKKGKYLY